MSRPYKRKAVDVFQKITPQIYKREDETVSALNTVDISTKVLLGEFKVIEEFHNLINRTVRTDAIVSSLAGWDEANLITSGLKKHFVKQNNLTEISPNKFSLEILEPLGYRLGDYTTSSDLYSFFSGTLFPKLKQGVGGIASDLYTSTLGLLASSNELTHEYLHNSLGLFYYTLYEGMYDPTVLLFAEKISKSETLYLADAIKIINENIWNLQANAAFSAAFSSTLLSEEFVSGTGQFVSGTQSLEKLNVWTDVLFEDNYREEGDTYVKDSIAAYFDGGISPEVYLENGPLYKFQRALGFIYSDLDNQILSLETLMSIDECPEEYLPYLADIVGWKFYTSNTDSWRRQIRDSRNLLQKKGTKKGLIDLLRSILPASTFDFSSHYSEFYESYVPNLIYYLLKTESSELSSLTSWTTDKANQFAGSWYDPVDLDRCIRFVVDQILLDAAHEFPNLFNVRGYPFRPNDSDFVFNYRSRDFSVPPWEYENFYKDCDITFELVEFLKGKLICLGVPTNYCESFEDYVLSNTVSGTQDPKFYNNGFFFLTENLQLPPNYQDLIENFEQAKFDYLGYWSGKSSHFDLTLCSVEFEDSIFVQTSFTTEDFFASMEAIKDFVPAKVISRVHTNLSAIDNFRSVTTLCPRVNFKMLDSINLSGALGSFNASSLNMRDPSLGYLGIHRNPSYDFANAASYNSHSSLPVFGREVLEFGRTSDSDAFVDSSSVYNVSGPYAEVSPRGANRRRNREKLLSKGNWFNRTGFNPPTFLNLSDTGSITEYLPLGLIPSTLSFEQIPDFKSLPEIYEDYQDLNSLATIYGVDVSSTFPVRGLEPYEGCEYYRFRDSFEEISKFIYDLVDHKISKQAELEIELNKDLLINDSWLSHYESLKNEIWNDYELDFEKEFAELGLDLYNRVPNEKNKTLNYLYLNNYIKRGKPSISDSTLEELDTGGSSLVSHLYGPIFWNAKLSVDGSAYGDDVVNLKNQDTDDDYEFLMFNASRNKEIMSTDFWLQSRQEERVPSLLSGVDIIDVRDTQNKMSVYNFPDDQGILGKDSALIDNNLVCLATKEKLPRLRYSFNYGETGNYLTPEDDFEITVSSLFLNDDTLNTGGRSYSVLIRTELETDYEGNKVVWVYTPKNGWEIVYFPSSGLSATNLESYVRTELSHRISHEEGVLEEKAGSECAISVGRRKCLYNLNFDDFKIDTLSFNTLNRNIKVPLSYYQYKNQVHRYDQKYVIELIPSNSVVEEDFWCLNGMSVVDKTLNLRTKVPFSVSALNMVSDSEFIQTKMNNFLSSQGLTVDDVEILFAKTDGSFLKVGDLITIENGEVFFETDRVTVLIKNPQGKFLFYKNIQTIIQSFADVTGPGGNIIEDVFNGSVLIKSYTLDQPFDYLDVTGVDYTYWVSSINEDDYRFSPDTPLLQFQNNSFVGSSVTETSTLLSFASSTEVTFPKEDFTVYELSAKYATHVDFEYYPTTYADWTNPLWNAKKCSLPLRDDGVLVDTGTVTIPTPDKLFDSTNLLPLLITKGDSYTEEFFTSSNDYSPYFSGNLPTPNTCDYHGMIDGGEPDGNVCQDGPWSFAEPSGASESDFNSNRYKGSCVLKPCFDYEPTGVLGSGDDYSTQVSLSVYRGDLSSLPEYLFIGLNNGAYNSGPLDSHMQYVLIPLLPNGVPDDKKDDFTTSQYLTEILRTNPTWYGNHINRGYPLTTDNVFVTSNSFYHCGIKTTDTFGEFIPAYAIASPDTDDYYNDGVGWWNINVVFDYTSIIDLEDTCSADDTFSSFFESASKIRSWLGRKQLNFRLSGGFKRLSIGLVDSRGSIAFPEENKKVKIGNIQITDGRRQADLNRGRTNYQQFSPYKILINPGTLGSYISADASLVKEEFDPTYPIPPAALLSLFRYFNDLSEQSQSRDSANTSITHGEFGGGKANYRIHPGPFNKGPDWLSNGNSVSSVEVRN